ncbi:MAG: hypothetical protein ABIS67_07530, partial [Candidatus Eisenbacteria bacterium]
MSATCRFGPVVIFSVLVLVSDYSTAPRDPRPSRDASLELARIRQHLEGAETMLLSRDISTLAADQRARRACLIAELRAYRRREAFPHNHLLIGSRTPVFVDEHGTRCAMAYLIERSGEGAMVSRIARTRNLARVRDLAGDPALTGWLDRNGLALEEAARIQPAYAYDAASNPGTWAASAIGAGVGLTGVGLNVSIGASRNQRNTRGLFGVLCGALGAALGVPGFLGDGGVRALGAADIGVGLVSFGLGI